MPKRQLDRFDLEAEQEGKAIEGHKKSKPKTVGKGLRAMREMNASGESKITNKIVRRNKWA